MGTFQITGRKAVGGVHRVPGNKNAALPMIAAALLSDEPVTIENVPDIADVRLMFEFAQRFGAKVTCLNLEIPAHDPDTDVFVQGKATEIVPKWCEEFV